MPGVRAMRDWIELSVNESGKLMAWIKCPECGFIVHLADVFFPARVSPSSSGKEMRIDLDCEKGHRFAIELADHSGTMMLQTVPIRD